MKPAQQCHHCCCYKPRVHGTTAVALSQLTSAMCLHLSCKGELGKCVLGTSTFYRKALLPNKSQRVEVTPKIGWVLKCQVTKQMASVQVKSGQAR